LDDLAKPDRVLHEQGVRYAIWTAAGSVYVRTRRKGAKALLGSLYFVMTEAAIGEDVSFTDDLLEASDTGAERRLPYCEIMVIDREYWPPRLDTTGAVFYLSRENGLGACRSLNALIRSGSPEATEIFPKFFVKVTFGSRPR